MGWANTGEDFYVSYTLVSVYLKKLELIYQLNKAPANVSIFQK